MAAYSDIETTVDGYEVAISHSENEFAQGCSTLTPTVAVFRSTRLLNSRDSKRRLNELDQSEFTYDGDLLTL